MSSVNKAIILGNLGADPIAKKLKDGTVLVNFSVATSEKFKDKAGVKQEITEWHKVSFFGKPAEIIEQYVKKGDKIYVEGSIRTRKYTDKEGVEKYITDIKGREFTLLGSRNTDTAKSTANTEDNFGEEDDIPF